MHQPHAEPTFADIDLALVDPSSTNPRRHFAQAYLDELAGSIKDKGVLQPVLLRPKAKGRFEIVAGECRTRAAKLAALTHIPAILRSLSDEQVLEIQLIENIHRRDLTPLEEARGYRALIDSNPTKHSAESIATRIGMSPAYVWDRLKLNDLIAEAKKILDLGLMTVGHAILIARLKPEDQERVIELGEDEIGLNGSKCGLWEDDNGRLDYDEDDDAPTGKKAKPAKYDGFKAVSVRELDRWIQHHIRFDVAHAAKAQPLTFETTAATVEAAAEQPGRGKKVIAITHEYRVADDARDDKERTYGSQSWERADGQAKSKTCEHSVLGVVVAGRGYGETLQVCVARDKCEVHFGDVIRERKKNQKLRENGKGQQAAKREADTATRDEAKRKADQAVFEQLGPRVRAAMGAKSKGTKFNVALVREILDTNQVQEIQKEFGVKLTPATAAQVLYLSQVPYLWNLETVRRVGKQYGVDVAKLEKSVRDEQAEKAAAKKGGK